MPHLAPSLRELVDSPWTRVTAGLLVAASLVGGGLYAVLRDPGADARGCEVRSPVRVSVAPDIAAVVTDIARRVSSRESGCVSVQVTEAAPERVLADVSAGGRAPDVWIPDSTLWLTRAKQDKVLAALDAPAIATSPLVLALPKATATRLQPTGRPTVENLVTGSAAGTLRVRLAAARLAPERVGTILALQAATAPRPDGRGAFAALLRGAVLAPKLDVTSSDGRSGSLALASSLAAASDMVATTTERAVWSANAGSATPMVVAVYPGAGTYDYPYAVLTTTARTRTAAGVLLDELLLPSSQSLIRSAGFRDATGRPGFDLTSERGVDGAQAVTPKRLDEQSLEQAEKSLAAVRLDARLHAVIDVSGSMAWGLAGKEAGGPSRLSIALAAAGAGLGLYPDTTEVELWAFSAPGSGRAAYTKVVPMTMLDAKGRADLTAGLRTLRPLGDTALYSTTLAAVREARRSWLPGRVNAVVVLSDGADTEGAMPLEQLTQTLAAEASADQPVPVITIAFGPDAPVDALAAISKATGGAGYRASSADEIRQVFLDAMGQRACRPNCG